MHQPVPAERYFAGPALPAALACQHDDLEARFGNAAQKGSILSNGDVFIHLTASQSIPGD